MISVEGLYFSYTGRMDDLVLDNVSLEIREGEALAILGDNGAGKTTLIKHFNGLLKPTKGVVYVDGVDTRRASVSELSAKVGVVFQYPEKMFFNKTVYDEIAFGLRNFGYNEKTIERIVDNVLSIFWLSKYKYESPFSLSGGEQRRLAIASVIAWNPKYIILDEPTAGQDAIQRELITNLINIFIERGKTVVIVTHDVEYVAENFKRVILMDRGRIIYDGEVSDLFRRRSLLERCNLLQPTIYKLESRLIEDGILKDGFRDFRDALRKIEDLIKSVKIDEED